MKVKISEAIIKEIIREYSDEQENSKNITLYHRISNKTNLNLEDFIRLGTITERLAMLFGLVTLTAIMRKTAILWFQ
jgi:hypothetical protein